MNSIPYLVRLIFSIQIEGNGQKFQFDEQLRLVWARDENKAMEVGQMIGYEEEEKFQNQNGTWVYWQFEGCQLIGNLGNKPNGSLVFSLTTEFDDPSGYLALVRNTCQKTEFQPQDSI